MMGRVPAQRPAASKDDRFRRIKKYQVVFVHDLVIACLSLPFALYLRLGSDFFEASGDVLLYGSPAFAALAGVTFHASGMYRGVWRYASMSDLMAVVKSATVAVLVFMPLMFLVNRLTDVPRSVPVIQWLVLIVLLGGPRFTYRLLQDGQWRLLPNRGEGPARAAGRRLRRRRVVHPRDARRPRSALPGGRHPGRWHQPRRSRIHGVPVLDTVERLATAFDRLKAQARPLASSSSPIRLAHGSRLRQLLDQAESLGMTVARLPSLVEFKRPTTPSRSSCARSPWRTCLAGPRRRSTEPPSTD